MSPTFRTALVSLSLLAVACSGAAENEGLASILDDNADVGAGSDAPSIEEEDRGGDCFGAPRKPAELCPMVVVSDELASPRDLAVRDGAAYVTTANGLVRVKDDQLDVVFSSSEAAPVYDVAIDGDWLYWTGDQLRRAPLADLGAVEPIARSVDWSVRASGGQVLFAVSNPDHSSTLMRLDTPRSREPQPVTTYVSSYALATDGSYAYYTHYKFGDAPSTTCDVRRVPLSGGEGERLATVEGAGIAAIEVTADLVFFATDKALYAARKGGGASARKVFDREPIKALTSDGEGVYFVAASGNLLRVYRSSLDGKQVRLLGQWYGDTFTAHIAVEASTLYITSVRAGVLLKIPKQ